MDEFIKLLDPAYELIHYIYKNADAHSQLGIYGAASKIAMIMAMITQAFRYAYEPFVFARRRTKTTAKPTPRQ